MRVGIATGEATESDGDFFGDPVVEAARLCAAAEGGQILATDLVRAVAGRHAAQELVSVGALELKGLPDPVACVEVRWEPAGDEPAAVPLPARLEAGSGIGFVGRAEELGVLAEVLKEAGTERRRRLVLVGGEPGIGKSCAGRGVRPLRPCRRLGGAVRALRRGSGYPVSAVGGGARPSGRSRPARLAR